MRLVAVFMMLLSPLRIGAQEAKPLLSADERFKADILLVVAHPDDEGGATPYLARAIYDEHKRVAVVFATRGGSGGDCYFRRPWPAPAGICVAEGGQAGAGGGIKQVWVCHRDDNTS